MPRSLKKGPFVDDHLLKKVDVANDKGSKSRHQDLVAPLDDHPRHARPHHRGARRPQARPGVRHRVDGRPQARRVRVRPAPSRATSRTTVAAAARLTGNERPKKIRKESMMSANAAAASPTRLPRARATARYVRLTPMKARRVVDLVRGRTAAEAAAILQVRPAGGQRAGRQGARLRGRQRREQPRPRPAKRSSSSAPGWTRVRRSSGSSRGRRAARSGSASAPATSPSRSSRSSSRRTDRGRRSRGDRSAKGRTR